MVTFDFSVSFDTRDVKAALDAMAEEAKFGAERIVQDAVTAVGTDASRMLRDKFHTRHTPTPSVPGEPPAMITGALAGSLRMQDAREVEPGVWEANVGFTIIYSRIQEFGGIAGKGHHSHLPPRPYLSRAASEYAPLFEEEATAWFRAAIGG